MGREREEKGMEWGRLMLTSGLMVACAMTSGDRPGIEGQCNGQCNDLNSIYLVEWYLLIIECYIEYLYPLLNVF